MLLSSQSSHIRCFLFAFRQNLLSFYTLLYYFSSLLIFLTLLPYHSSSNLNSLEFELTEKASRWQPVRVSDNIASGEVFSTLPGVMTKAPWELIFLLLLSKEQHSETLQALFDTGLCPRQGLIAYIRLLEQVQQRAESWEGVPSHRKITEFEIFL